MKLRCFTCGKIVSTEVPEDTIVRACLECPECLEKEEDKMSRQKKKLDTAKQFGKKLLK